MRYARPRLGERALVFQIGAASGLRRHDVLGLLRERGHKAQGYGEHERSLAHGYAHALQRGEQVLGGVGQRDGRGGEGEARPGTGLQEESGGLEHGGVHAAPMDVQRPHT